MGKPKRKYVRKTKPAVAETNETVSSKITSSRTAHECLTAFLRAWKEQNWKVMSDCCQLTWLESGHVACTPDGWLQMYFGFKNLKSYKIMPDPEKARDWNYMLAFIVEADIAEGPFGKATMKINVVFESKAYNPVDPGDTYGQWGVNPISAIAITWSK